LNADWSVATTYFNGLDIDDHLRQTSGASGVSYFLTDHLGSTSTLTDATGNPVEQGAYDSFGNSAGSAHTRYGYTGRERDPDTGMLYYRARFYDPSIGRFTSEDPVNFDGGINWYAYVENNPISNTDPFGLQKYDGELSELCTDCDTIDNDILILEASLIQAILVGLRMKEESLRNVKGRGRNAKGMSARIHRFPLGNESESESEGGQEIAGASTSQRWMNSKCKNYLPGKWSRFG
jgi:RHS repeat-associated protein